MFVLIIILSAGLAYLGYWEYSSHLRYENSFKGAFHSLDSLRAELDSLEAKRKIIKSLAASIKQREKERKNEAADLYSIDSLASLANGLLSGKSN
ncbi:MAG: hypothetical protein ACM3QX_14940 [Syntrophomonadaceae bacterium]